MKRTLALSIATCVWALAALGSAAWASHSQQEPPEEIDLVFGGLGDECVTDRVRETVEVGEKVSLLAHVFSGECDKGSGGPWASTHFPDGGSLRWLFHSEDDIEHVSVVYPAPTETEGAGRAPLELLGVSPGLVVIEVELCDQGGACGYEDGVDEATVDLEVIPSDGNDDDEPSSNGHHQCESVGVTIEGTPGDDHLIGTGGDDVIAGRGGNDYIDGGGGIDLICAGKGRDVVGPDAGGSDYHDPNQSVYGGPGNDRLLGGPAGHSLYGGTGADYLKTGSAADDFDHADGGPGRDLLVGSGGSETFSGGPGSDRVRARGGVDVLFADPGKDKLWGGEHADVFRATDVRAPVNVDLGKGVTWGAAGRDRLGGIENIDGSDYAGTLIGDHRSNVIQGGGIWGGASIIRAGGGDDSVFPAYAEGTVRLGRGDDEVLEGPEDHVLFGGPGEDTFELAHYGDTHQGVVIDLLAGSLTGFGTDRLHSFEIVYGTTNDDELLGGPGDESLIAGPGDDHLDGRSGRDTLDGGPDQDRCVDGEVLRDCEA